MAAKKKPRFLARRIRTRTIELPGDPFAQTKVDYAFNLLVGGTIPALSTDLRHTALAQHFVLESKALARLRRSSGPRLSDETFSKLVLEAVRAEGRDLRAPTEPDGPVATNLELLAKIVGASDTEREVLQFAIASREGDMRALLDPIPCGSMRQLVGAIATAIARPSVDVDAALRATSGLVSMGLLNVHEDHGDVDDWLTVDPRLLRVLPVEGIGPEGLWERFVPIATPPSLDRADYPHLAAELGLAERILRGALREAKPGVNVLLYGPTGTGKTELARLLAHACGAPLFVAGRADDEGGSPSPAERLTSLKLGHKILRAGQGVLLFDEVQDLFGMAAVMQIFGSGNDQGRMSKQWFNLLLEQNPVPTIWISNDITHVDPAYLRRFTFVVEVGELTTSGRRRTWLKHLGAGHSLPANDLDALARRFEVSPALIGGTVAACRLANDGAVDRPTLEAVLRPSERALKGRRSDVATFEPGRYRPEIVNTPVDLEQIACKLEAWRPGAGVGPSLCLYGPPGTGKSAFVHYLAHRMDRPVLVRRASDLLSKWVGETEENIAKAFEAAGRDGAVLLFDEVDSFLRDRRDAVRSWEVTETNEFLEQLEVFTGVVACTTNLMRTIDQAAMRRFAFKLPFLYMRSEQAVALLRAMLQDLGIALEEGSPAEVAVARIGNLAPGDFAAAARRVRILGAEVTAAGFVAELEAEVRVKETPSGRIGF